MGTASGGPPGLFFVSAVEPKEQLENELEANGKFVRQIVYPGGDDQPMKSSQETHDALMSAANAHNENHEKVCLGLFYVILTETSAAPQAFQDLTLVTRDHFGLVMTKLNIIIVEKYFKLLDTPRQQLLWFLNQLLGANCIGSNQSCLFLMKNIMGGDLSLKNVWLAEKVLDIFIDYQNFLFKGDPVFVGLFIYTYLRLICDHRGPKHESLRSKEINFCIEVLRERFLECAIIGRDLVRLLQNLSRIPQFEQFWKDMLLRPQTINPKFTGILSLLQTRTQRKFIAARLTVEMENKLNFLLSKVKFGNQKRYQDWFQKSYLTNPESQNLCPDLIRYICCVIHPTNEILCSDIIPRWAVIGWLLLQCKSNSIAAECKLALFFDWLTFHVERDNIMNIEPAVLVMYHNLKHHPATSITLLDFLCRIQGNFYPPLESHVRQGVQNSFKLLLEKRVLPSLAPIFESNKLDPDLKALVKNNFGDFMEMTLPGPGVVGMPPPPPPADPQKVTEALLEDLGPPAGPLAPRPASVTGEDSGLDSGPEVVEFGGVLEASSDEDSDDVVAPPVIVDEEVEIPISKILQEHTSANSVNSEKEESNKAVAADFVATVDLLRYPPIEALEAEDITKYFSQLEGDLLDIIKKLHADKLVTRNPDLGYALVERVAEVTLSFQSMDRDACVPLASSLCTLLIPNFPVPVLPVANKSSGPQPVVKVDPQDKTIEEIFKRPLYSLFKVMCQNFNDTNQLSNLLAEMYEINPRIGYHMLFFLASCPHAQTRNSIYGDLVLTLEDEISSALVKDLHLASQHDINLFLHLIPFVFQNFNEDAVGQVALMKLIVSAIDPTQLNHVISQVMLDEVELLEDDSILPILTESLEWECWEQSFLWQLIGAHELTAEHLVPIVHKVSWQQHPEASTALLLRLKRDKPSAEVVKHLFSRTCKPDQENSDRLCTSMLYYWSVTCYSQLAEITRKLITGTSGSPSARSKPGASKSPTLTEILRQLDKLRQNVDYKNDSFFSQNSLLEGLKFAHLNIYKTQRHDFEELFGLANMSDNRQRGKRGLRESSVGSTTSESDASDEEKSGGSSGRPRRKQRKVVSQKNKSKVQSSSESENSE